jgi:4-aminobutyrate aminotransferase/(S)-3-amino-2-methylpropionate transaminase
VCISEFAKEDSLMAVKAPLSTQSSKALFQKMSQYVPRAVSPLAPFIIAEGRGAVVKDLEGNSYIDLTGGWGCLSVGHAHPKVVRAIHEQAQRFTHTDCSVIMYDVYIELAERLVKLAPGPSPKKAIFFNSGAEAVENAVKIARSYTKRKAVVVFEGAFHGRTYMALTMTHKAKPYKEGFAPFCSDVYRMPFPNPYRNPMDFRHWEKQLFSLVNPDEIACIVFEPVQGEGGFVVPQEGFVQFLRELTYKHGIVLVADEIQTGIGRTGKFYASEHYGIEPDLMTLAKSLAAGMPLSAVVGVQRVIDAPGDSAIGGTYVGNPVACAAALAVLDIIEEERLARARGGARSVHARALRADAAEVRDRGRRARPGGDGGHRIGERPHDQGARLRGDDGYRSRVLGERRDHRQGGLVWERHSHAHPARDQRR